MSVVRVRDSGWAPESIKANGHVDGVTLAVLRTGRVRCVTLAFGDLLLRVALGVVVVDELCTQVVVGCVSVQ